MIEYDPEKRVRTILNCILPSILHCVKGKEAQMRMLERNRLKAHELNAECEYAIDDLEERFIDARQYIEAGL